MKKTGIITYHAAYNYGSVLQAFATQKVVETLNQDVEIVNYRMLEQRRFYSLYRPFEFGKSAVAKDLLQLPIHAKRKKRQQEFEKFFSGFMKLSKEFSEPKDIAQIWNKYDIVISGSDQIWNKHSCELEHNDWRYMEPYLLKGYAGKKISYASSTASMNDSELNRILPYIKQFSYISMREKSSAERMTKLLGRQVENVLDPTFLLTAEQWKKNLKITGILNTPYVLYYSLGGIKKISSHLKSVKDFANKMGCILIVVTPFAWYPSSDSTIENHPEYGPVEFLSALNGAKAVVTDSYHGTILSINFNKEFYSICGSGRSEFRKTDILERLGLQDRIIYDPNGIVEKKFEPIDYDKVNEKLDRFRKHSLNYLKRALI